MLPALVDGQSIGLGDGPRITPSVPQALIKAAILESPYRITFKRVRNYLPINGPEDGSKDVDELHRLAAAVVLSALFDAAGKSGRAKRMHEARAWLLDEENQFPWFDLAGIKRKQILAWFEAGCPTTRLHKGSFKKSLEKKFYNLYELKTEPPREKASIDPDLGPEY